MTVLEQLRTALGDRYDLERELGGGGMSQVFLAVERALDRRVVIKVLPPELGQSVNADRFRREIATLATLQHPQIVPIHAAGTAGDLLYYVMPFVAGESLRARLDRESRMAAPEVVLAEPDIDGRADVYSLAALAWELLAGRPPFEGTAQQVMSAHVVKEAPSVTDVAPQTPAALAAVLTGRSPRNRPNDTRLRISSALEESLRSGINGHAASGAGRPVAPPAKPRNTDASPVEARRGIRVAALVGVVAMLAGSAWWWSRRAAAVAPVTATAAVATASARAGIAVLPFDQIGGSDDAYLAAGLADELMTQLAEVPELRVAARTTVRAFADSSLTPTELGSRLDVRALVEGSVQRAKNQLRVTTRLVDVRDGSTLWSNRYERTTDDLFAVQREIGAAVVAALTPKLGLTPRARTDAKGTADAAAFDLFLRGRFALQQRGVDSLRTAITRFREAIARDGSFARAWAGVAEATALLPVYGGGSWDVYGPQVREAATRAMALDSTLGTPHFALAMAAKGVGDWATAEREFDLALARQPDLGATHQNRAELLYTLGRVDDAVTAMARAATLEPADVPIISQFAGTLVIGGRLDSARRVLDRSLARDSTFVFAYWSAMMLRERQGDARGALTAATRAAQLAPLPFFIGLSVRAAQLARDSAAERLARRALIARGSTPGTALAWALAESEVAPADSTMARLDRAVTERDPLMWQIPLRLWLFDRVRGTPSFARLAQRLKLPAEVLEPFPAAGR